MGRIKLQGFLIAIASNSHNLLISPRDSRPQADKLKRENSEFLERP
jgi:hypothetical protein